MLYSTSNICIVSNAVHSAATEMNTVGKRDKIFAAKTVRADTESRNPFTHRLVNLLLTRNILRHTSHKMRNLFDFMGRGRKKFERRKIFSTEHNTELGEEHWISFNIDLRAKTGGLERRESCETRHICANRRTKLLTHCKRIIFAAKIYKKRTSSKSLVPVTGIS